MIRFSKSGLLGVSVVVGSLCGLLALYGCESTPGDKMDLQVQGPGIEGSLRWERDPGKFGQLP